MRTEAEMDEFNREDQAIQVALERLSGLEGVDENLTPEDAALVREYTEVLGLMAYEMEPSTPNVSTKVRVLAAIAGQDPAPQNTPAAASVAPTDAGADRSFDEMTFRARTAPQPEMPVPASVEATPSELTLRHENVVPPDVASQTMASPNVVPPNVVQHPQAFQPVAPRTSNWASWAMAAMLAACLLGLGYFAGRVGELESTLTVLRHEASTVPVQIAELDQLRQELSTVKRRFHMVTRVARGVYPMQRMGEDGSEGEVGKLYVCGAHQRWYLNLEELAPAPAGKEYRLWFMTAEGPVDGGPIQVTDEATAEMDALTMPSGTTGFTVTVEDAGAALEGPAGAMVLLGEEKISL